MRLRKILSFLLLFVCIMPCDGILPAGLDIFGGNWNLTIDSSDLQAGAGSDLIDTYTSTAGAIWLHVWRFGFPASWRVDVKRVDGTWHSSFHIWVQRSANPGYIEVTTTDQTFFSGWGDQWYSLQHRLTGVSIQIPPGTYNTTIVYTAVDI